MALNDVFESLPSNKVLKLVLRNGKTNIEGLREARRILDTNPQYSKVEFRDLDYYYVVSRLRKTPSIPQAIEGRTIFEKEDKGFSDG